jgi:hypothetical protein
VTIDVGALIAVAEAQHNVVGVEAVFNHTDDPSHNVNLYSSYNPTTKVVTITSAQTVGDVLIVRIIYEPYVVFEATDQDYTPVEKIPIIILSSLRSDGSTQASVSNEVVNKAAKTAYVFPPMMHMRYTCQLQTLTPSGTDEQRLVDAIKLFFGDNPIIRTVGTDEKFELFLADAKYTSTTTPSEGDAHTSTMSFRIQGIYFQVKRTLTSQQDHVYPVSRVITTNGVVVATQTNAAQFLTPARIASSAAVNSPTVETT